MSNFEPKGDLVPGPPARLPDPTKPLVGQHSISLVPLRPSHIPGLFDSLGGPQNDHLYTYLPGGPFHTLEPFTEHISSLLTHPIFFPYTIISLSPSTPELGKAEVPIGVITLMNIVPLHRTSEIGHVLYGTMLQRTPASTEANYLLMKYAFEELGCLRVEWKANDWNEPSKRAAVRLKFKSEGVFRKHYVIKGEEEGYSLCWMMSGFKEGKGSVKAGLEGWLAKENFDGSGKQIRKLEEVRDGFVLKGGWF